MYETSEIPANAPKRFGNRMVVRFRLDADQGVSAWAVTVWDADGSPRLDRKYSVINGEIQPCEKTAAKNEHYGTGIDAFDQAAIREATATWKDL